MAKKTKIQPLALTYRKNGFDFRQVTRAGNVAIYEQSDEGKFIAFEVFEIRQQGEREFNGTKIEAMERCPSNEEWGTNAFSVRTKEAAIKRANEIIQRIRERVSYHKLSFQNKNGNMK
jgi:hypothetical protein